MELYDSQNNPLQGSFTCDATGTLAAVPVTTGQYTININADGATGSFDIQAYSITPINSSIMVDGPAVPLTASTPGQIYNLSVSGNAGQEVSLAATDFPFFDNCIPLVTLSSQNNPDVDHTTLDEEATGPMVQQICLPELILC